MIIHQIWNQRRRNLWIWLELAVLSAFLWIAIDPLFTMVCLKSVPTNFDSERMYVVRPGYYFYGYDKQKPNDNSDFVPSMANLLTRLEAHPMVESACLVREGLIPGSSGYPDSRFYRNPAHAKLDEGKEADKQNHCTRAESFVIPCIAGLEKWTDVTYTFGMRDAISGEYVHVRPDALARKLTYVSEGMARRLYGSPNVKDSTIYRNEGDNVTHESGAPKMEAGSLRIDAVYADVKGCDFETPRPGLFELMDCNNMQYFFNTVCVRLKEGADGKRFMESVPRDVLKDCCTAPFSGFEINSLQHNMDLTAELVGSNNVVRIQSALGFFGLLCVFLGVSGLFWVRCGERRQDMGVMRSMGASRRAVKRQMLWEGVILLTAAFLTAMLFVAWYVHKNGYNMGLTERIGDWAGPDLFYWFNRPWPHVIAVTVLTYALMLLITLLATWLPVHRATRILPCDALRDE